MLKSEINTMRNWVLRREAQNKNWTADELWARIQRNWPALSESDKERIFQECDGCVRRLADAKGGRK